MTDKSALLLPLLVSMATTDSIDSEARKENMKLLHDFLREPPYIILMVGFGVIFIIMWFVADLPPHEAKKNKK